MVLSPTFPVSQPNESVTERDFRYMTSAVGGGGESQKSRQKEQNQLISVCDKVGEGVKKSDFADVQMEAPKWKAWQIRGVRNCKLSARARDQQRERQKRSVFTRKSGKEGERRSTFSTVD